MSNVSIRPLKDLQGVLPKLASTMSISRTHLVIDQLRSLIEQSRGSEILLLTFDGPTNIASSTVPSTTVDRAAKHDSQASVVAYHPANTDFATLLLAGWSAGDANDAVDDLAHRRVIESVARALVDVLDPLLYRRGVRFLQYATDVSDTITGDDESHGKSFPWQQGLGLRHIGNLEYQSGSTEEVIKRVGDEGTRRLSLRPIGSLAEFSQLVQRTYSQTMDCPTLSKFRSAEQTLCGYRQTDAFNPDLWFTVHRASSDLANVDDAVGCLIMGTHQNEPAQSDETESAANANAKTISELVYMGLVPETRGEGLGIELIKEAAHISRKVGAQRLILAVDEANDPARDLYRRAGMQPMMRESVWGKLVSSHECCEGA